MDESTDARALKEANQSPSGAAERIDGNDRRQTDRSHPPEYTRRQKIEKLIRSNLETKTHNPIWRVAIFSAIAAIGNQRFLG